MAQLLQRGDEFFGLWLVQRPPVNQSNLALTNALGKRRPQRPLAHLPGHVIRPIARLRPMHISAALPKWRTERCDSRPAGAFLFPQLASGARNVAASFGARCSLP